MYFIRYLFNIKNGINTIYAKYNINSTYYYTVHLEKGRRVFYKSEMEKA